MSLDISIIIPVYNSSALLRVLVDEIKNAFNKYQFEIIFIDDCSTDNSWDFIEQLKQEQKDIHIQAIRLNKNFGQHNAILCGLRFSSADYVITMDDDMEVLPSEMVKAYITAKQDQMDLVYASYQKKYDSFIRNALTSYFHFWAKITSGKKREKGSGYRVISKRMIDEIKNHQSEIFFIDEIITWYTSRIVYVKVQKNPQKLIKSRYSIRKLFNTSLGLILLSYLFPIRSVSIIGGFIALVNFLIGIYFMYKKFLLKIPVEGYTSLIVSVLFSTGIILLFIGVLAEYINKILRVSSKAPNYFIDKKI
jgi:glycosyltransferase involved in cell wall biosynthesis